MKFLRRVAYWLRLRSNHDDLIDEIAFHREMVEQDLVRGGLSPETAHIQARRTMGNETLMREEARGIWLWPSLEAVLQDASYTLRDLRRNPVFTLGVTLTLALGIGANAAMFSLVDRLLLRPPAMMIHPETVHQVYLYKTVDGVERETGGRYATYTDIVRRSTSFSRTSAFRLTSLAIGVGEETRLRNVAIVSAGFFGFFDAPPALGRYYTASEDSPPSPAPVAVLSHAVWQTQYGARRDIVGTTVQIDAVTYTIIGVAPEGFVGLWPFSPPSAFIPVTTYAASHGPPDWATTYSRAIGIGIIVQRKPNVTQPAATADLTNAFLQSFRIQDGQYEGAGTTSQRRPRAVAASVLDQRRPEGSSLSRAGTWLSAVTLIVLLIACANVANLLLARTIRRRREIALRIALGVSRRRLFGQLLTEGVILALLGGIGGVVIAAWASRALTTTLLPGAEPAPLLDDTRTLAFVGLIALGVGILTGLAPMTQVRRLSLTSDLKSGPREGTYQRRSLRTALLILQSALSVALLVGAGLFVRSLQHVRDVRLGFHPDSVALVELNMRNVRLDSATAVALRRRLLEAAARIPGVSHVSLQEAVPFAGVSSYPIVVAGMDSTSELGEFDVNTVSTDYFATMGTRILRGRGFEDSDRDGGRLVVVVGESMARVLWPGRDAIGQCVRVGLEPDVPCRYVVGIAEDIHSQSLDAESRLFYYYMPAAQWNPQNTGLFVRARGDVRALVEPVRRQLQRDMPGSSFVTVRPLADIVDNQMRVWITGASVFSAFGVLALVLAAVGLYSVIAYNVTQRKHELGVRLALGAGRGEIVRLVVGESVRFAMTGTVIGAIVAALGGGWIEPLLFHQRPRDPSIFAFVGITLIGVAILASWIPALRAAGVDPKSALQSD
jgi:predicted permease